MKRQVLLTLAVTMFFYIALTAQSNTTNAGKFSVSAGLGILPTYFNDGASTKILPVSFRAGYVIGKHFTLNACFGFSSTASNPKIYGDGLFTQIENTTFIGGLRGEIRHEISKKLEFYGGGMLGISHANINEVEVGTGTAINRNPDEPSPYNPNPPKSTCVYSGFVGAVYFIQPKLGVYTELGYGISLVSAGFTFRM